MCGFAGILDLRRSTSAPALRREVAAMAATLKHRGPDSSGTWEDADAGLALGHQRLAIVDLSALGHQPMVSASGRYVIAFNGEVFNFRELRQQLPGFHFNGHSDTEVMLAAIEAWGVRRAIESFVGMFAFALWDSRERKLHLVRDRLGVKPLYWGKFGSTVLFGSELRAIETHYACSREIDPGAVSLLMRFGCVPAPHTIYRGVHKLLPGTHLVLDAATGAEHAEPYWTLRDCVQSGARQPFAGSDAEAIDATEALLRDSIRKRLIADVPIGLLLSGGIDSSTVAALAQAESTKPIKTFSIGFDVAAYDEADSAARVARHLGTDHLEMRVTAADALAAVPQLASIYDEPFADPSQLPTFLVCRLARKHVTVCLSGDGGDEVFAGYNRHLWGARVGRVPAWLGRPLGGALGALPLGMLEGLYAALRPVLPGRLRVRDPGDKLQKLALALKAGEPGRLYRSLVSQWQAPGDVAHGAEPQTLLDRDDQWPALPDLMHRMMYLDTLTYLPDDVLTKVDRASMAVALETREPLLDHRLVEHLWRMPADRKIRDGETKWLLRRVLERYVPRALTDRPKWGFAIPLDQWLRGELRAWAEDLLREGTLNESGLLRPGPILAAWRAHLAGQRNAQMQLWPVLMLQAWLRRPPVEVLQRT